MKRANLGIPKDIEKAVQKTAFELLAALGDYFFGSKRQINEIILVPITIFARIMRVHDATKLLLESGYCSEAAVLTLTQFELRLDLGHTASDIKKAGAWIGHVSTRSSLQHVAASIDGLYESAEDRETLKLIFQYLSGVKHGNPVYSELGFPGRVVGRTIQLSTGEFEDEFAEQFKAALFAYAAYQLAWASQVLNKFTLRYAKADKELRLRANKHYLELEWIEKRFLEFLTSVTEKREGHFGLRKFAKKKV